MQRKKHRLFLLLILTVNVAIAQIDHWETAVFADDTWSYLVPTSEPDANWNLPTYDASNWQTGKGGFGYADNDDGTNIAQCNAVYLRKTFDITDLSSIEALALHMEYDDGFVAYLNGEEIARAGLTGTPPAFDENATDHEAKTIELFTIDLKDLTAGANLLAIQVNNAKLTSSDLSSNAYLSLGINNDSFTYRETPTWFDIPTEFHSSNLPIFIINTNGQTIVDEPKVSASLKIIANADGSTNTVNQATSHYLGTIGIEKRGSYSMGLPQKPYGIETWDINGADIDVSLLGMPPEEDWILLANYNDKVFVRNTLAYEISRNMGHYAPRTEWCELVLNDSYEGIYIFTEKIKRNKGRVDIAKLDTNEVLGDDVSGGYIIKVDYYKGEDYWVGSNAPYDAPGKTVRYVHEYPTSENLQPEQRSYIQSFVTTLESKLYSDDFKDPINGYRPFIDSESFIDYFLISEFTRNGDAYKKSSRMFKDKDSKGGSLHAGPVWDFDWAYKNVSNCSVISGLDGSGWAHQVNQCNPSPYASGWIVRLLEDEWFAGEMKCRYKAMRKTLLSEEYIFNYIDSAAYLLDEAQQRHYERWPILGGGTDGAPEKDYQPDTFEGEINKFKDWISLRLNWLDANMPGVANCELFASDQTPLEALIRVFPNPVSETLYIESDNEMRSTQLISVSGQVMINALSTNPYSKSMQVEDLQAGMYFVKINFKNGSKEIRKVIIQ